MARCLILMFSLLLPYYVYASSDGSGETTLPMRGSRMFCQRGSKSDKGFFVFFMLMRGERIQIPLKAGRWWPNIECWLGSFVIFHKIRTSISKKPYIFVIFQGLGAPKPLSPLWIRPCFHTVSPEPLLLAYAIRTKKHMLQCVARQN